MSRVRVNIRLGKLDLGYEGTEAFYQQCVDPLVLGAYAQGLEHLLGPGAPGAPAPGAGADPRPAGGAPAPAASAATGDEPSPGAPVEALPEGPVSSPGQFAGFLKQVGERAAEPEQQAMAFAFYLWNYERMESFQASDLAACFGLVHLPVPPDLFRIVSDLQERRRFLAASEDDEYQLVLTPKGVNYVKNRLLTSL